MTVCAACGRELVESANFCPHCGSNATKTAGDTTRIIPVVDDLNLEDILEQSEAALDALPEGSAMLIVVRGNQPGARFLINADRTTAGRHPRSDIFLDDITVSRHHAHFDRRDGQMWVGDAGSLNGTYVNNILIEGEVLLSTGDTVQIGKFRMVYFDGNPGPI